MTAPMLTQLWAALTTHPMVTALVAAALLLVYLDLRRRLPIMHLPGNKTDRIWPVLGTLPAGLHHMLEGTVVDWARQNAKANDFRTWAQYSPFVSEIFLCDPESMKHMFNTHFQNYQLPWIRKECFREALGEGIFNSDGPRWKDQRSFTSHLFSASQLRRRMRDVFEAHARKVRKQLEAAAPGEVIDMQRLMYCYTFDCICEIAYGIPVDSLGGVPADLEFQKAFDGVQKRSSGRFFDMFWKLKRGLNICEEAQMRKDCDTVNQYIEKMLVKRDEMAAAGQLGGDSDSSDLLTIFEEHCQESGSKATRQELRDLVMNFMIAGRDTTACVLTWTIWELSRDPEARARAEEDIKQHADPDAMEYMQAVFQEVLRLHPSVPMDGKECVRDDVLPDGTKVRKGTIVDFAPCVITRNPKLFPDPDSFVPTRWLDEEGRCRKYDEYAYPCFNAGPRICLGRHMAPLEAKTLLAELMHTLRFDVPSDFVPECIHTVVIMTKNGMPAKVTKRPDAR
eukprot:TRINITY_DN777_c0_g1_i7.p1 TRINITY_DN777_c0_g1~~TRINITY_DN777_c0_g1_i7.p1  ORF type:complete len:508 (+),score=197.04 TRINITY_DN777_c0_g1_i7:88-1611(+)